jgi:hypothetical protein
MVTLPLFKILQILHKDSLIHKEQLLFLSQLQIPSGLQVKNSGTNSNLKLSQILKGFKPFWKNMINSIKLYIHMLYLKVNLHWHTCIQILEVPLQVEIGTL